jgi:hypothetical protein
VEYLVIRFTTRQPTERISPALMGNVAEGLKLYLAAFRAS